MTVDAKDLIREVAIFADRGDISEEIVRLRAHLAQYDEVIDEPESAGGSWSSSSRRWAARSTRSARRPTTSRSAGTWSRSKGFWKKSAN